MIGEVKKNSPLLMIPNPHPVSDELGGQFIKRCEAD